MIHAILWYCTGTGGVDLDQSGLVTGNLVALEALMLEAWIQMQVLPLTNRLWRNPITLSYPL